MIVWSNYSFMIGLALGGSTTGILLLLAVLEAVRPRDPGTPGSPRP